MTELDQEQMELDTKVMNRILSILMCHSLTSEESFKELDKMADEYFEGDIEKLKFTMNRIIKEVNNL